MNEIIKETIENKFNNMFLEARKKEQQDRTGIHTTSIIATPGSFCYREQVLQYLFNNEKDIWLPARVVRRMRNGDYIHKKWQDLFNKTRNTYFTEDQFKSIVWGFTGSPDSIIEVLNRKWVVEIKSIKSDNYESMTKVPIGVERQIQMYMYLTAIPQGIVLYENTDTSEFKPWIVEYKPNLVSKYIIRLYKIKVLIDIYSVSERLPKRQEKCNFKDEGKAKRCEMSEVCFGNHSYRRKMLKDVI